MSQRKSTAQIAQARAVGQALRKRRGQMTQAEVAEKAGITRSALANYELGRTIPPLAVIERLAPVFNVDVEALLPAPNPDDWDEVPFTLNPQVSEDEMSLLRVLRTASDEVVCNVVAHLLHLLETKEDAFRFSDQERATKDVASLYRARMHGQLRRLTADNVAKIARRMSGEPDPS